MFTRSLRLSSVFILLACLLLLSCTPYVGAASRSPSGRHIFQPVGSGIVKPQQVSTRKISQQRGTSIISETSMASQKTSISHSLSRVYRRASAPQNIVVVPPPTSTDPSANGGLSSIIQPDANGTGGLYNYLETVNQYMAIYNSTGTMQYETTLPAWFKTPGSLKIFDPVTTWDNTGNRFMFTALTGKTLKLSVAQQSNALGNYCNYTFQAPSGLGFDFDKLGVDADGVYISSNLLSNGNFVSNILYYINRSQIENCGQSGFIYWTQLTNPDGTLAEAIVPAVQDNSTRGIEYLVNSYPTGACQLTLWEMTKNYELSNIPIATQCYIPPPPAIQKGSKATINPGDSSLTQASYINGLLTIATEGSYDWQDGNGPVGIIKWFVLNPAVASVASQGAFGTPGFWLLYPAAIRTLSGNMLFVYNAVGPTIYPSVWYVNQSFNNAHALSWGQSYYFTNGEAPAGDYQSAWQDIAGKSDGVWITGEYGKTPTSWGTKFGLVYA